MTIDFQERKNIFVYVRKKSCFFKHSKKKNLMFFFPEISLKFLMNLFIYYYFFYKKCHISPEFFFKFQRRKKNREIKKYLEKIKGEGLFPCVKVKHFSKSVFCKTNKQKLVCETQ